MYDLTRNVGVYTGQLLTGTITRYKGHGLKTDDFVVVSGVGQTTTSSVDLRLSDVEYNIKEMKKLAEKVLKEGNKPKLVAKMLSALLNENSNEIYNKLI